MMRRLLILTIVSVFGWTYALSAPLIAAGSAQSAKAQPSVVVKSEVSKPSAAHGQLSSVTSSIVQAIKFQFGRWFGLSTVLPVVDKEPNVRQKCDHDTNRLQDKTKDKGGDGVAT